MIRVTVELLPYGREANKKTLGVLEIANDGRGTTEVGHYSGRLMAEYTGTGVGNTRVGRVEHFHRKKQSVWSLVGAFLKLFGHTRHSPRHMHKNKET